MRLTKLHCHMTMRVVCCSGLITCLQIFFATAIVDSAPELLFAVSPPFHGNALLSELLSTCPSVMTKYCDTSNFNNNFFHKIAHLGLVMSYDERRAAKMPSLEDSIESLPHGSKYADMSPNFAIGWHDIVLRDLASKHPVTLIVIRDSLPRALSRLQSRRASLSFWRFQNSSDIYSRHLGHSSLFPVYSQHYRLANTRPLRRWKESTDDDMLAGYLVDFEAMRQNIISVAALRRRVKVIDVRLEEIVDSEAVAYLLMKKLGLRNCNMTKINELLGDGPNKSRNMPYRVPREVLFANTKFMDTYIEESRNTSKLSVILPSMHQVSAQLEHHYPTKMRHVMDATGSLYFGDSSFKYTSEKQTGQSKLPFILHQGVTDSMISPFPIYFTNPIQFVIERYPVFILEASPHIRSLRRPAMRGERRFFLNSTLYSSSTNDLLSHVNHPTDVATIMVRNLIFSSISPEHHTGQTILKLGSCSSNLTSEQQADSAKPRACIACHRLNQEFDKSHKLFRFEISILITDLKEDGSSAVELREKASGWFSFYN